MDMAVRISFFLHFVSQLVNWSLHDSSQTFHCEAENWIRLRVVAVRDGKPDVRVSLPKKKLLSHETDSRAMSDNAISLVEIKNAKFTSTLKR